MFNDMNSGYSGYSMSRRAREAYDDGEKPLSKWTKQDIIDSITEYATEADLHFNIDLLKKLKVAVLKKLVLYRSSWHHTSSYANRTEFYDIDRDKLDTLTDEEINKILVRPIENTKNLLDSKAFRGNITYLEWEGTRKHPKATEHTLENVNIEEKGCFYIVTDDKGRQLLKKKIDSRGTSIVRK